MTYFLRLPTRKKQMLLMMKSLLAMLRKEKVKRIEVYPALGDQVRLSANTIKMKNLEDNFVKVFHGLKTLEYDLALIEANRDPMLTALADPHPKISKALRNIVDAQPDNTAKPKCCFAECLSEKATAIFRKVDLLRH